MTQKDKQLLLNDLCGRLPYGVRVLVSDTFPYSTIPGKNAVIKVSDIHDLIAPVSLDERYNKSDKAFSKIIQEHTEYLEFKPYLRPMSSMTEEEKDELNSISHEFGFEWVDAKTTEERYMANAKMQSRSTDFYNAHHLDYRGLIEKGLALEAHEDMYML